MELHNVKEKFIFTGRLKAITLGVTLLGLILTVIGMLVNPDGRHGHGESVTHGVELSEQQNVHEEEGIDYATDLKDHPTKVVADHDAASGHHENIGAKRFWANLLLSSTFWFLISLCGTFFIAFNYLANAGWAVVLNRIAEAVGVYLPISAVALLIIMAFGSHSIYHWAHEAVYEVGNPEYDPLLVGKREFLNEGFLMTGFVIFAGLMILFTYLFRRNSLLEDVNGGLKYYDRSLKFAVFFLVAFGLGISFFGFGFLMSTNPHWYSTIYGVYVFAGMFVGGMTVITMIAILLKNAGFLAEVRTEHIHDMGKFMFAFSIFWTYIWVSQFLLIWYGNIPEETIYYDMRWAPNWKTLFWLNLIINFTVPLLLLMSRHTKRNFKFLFAIGIVILIGRFMDIYLLIMPDTVGLDASTFGFIEIGCWLFFGGIFAFTTAWALSRANLIPMHHPYLGESLHHEIPV
ncbi:MAG: quinol:cytochrome C oxidoreductase [Bacteroidia bacterium]